jgi:hypothetical protein
METSPSLEWLRLNSSCIDSPRLKVLILPVGKAFLKSKSKKTKKYILPKKMLKFWLPGLLKPTFDAPFTHNLEIQNPEDTSHTNSDLEWLVEFCCKFHR